MNVIIAAGKSSQESIRVKLLPVNNKNVKLPRLKI
jgi:hypothetical protein